MKNTLVCIGVALLVAALVAAAEPTVTRTPSEPRKGPHAPNSEGVPTIPVAHRPVVQLPPPAEPVGGQDDLGWGVDVWKDSYGGTGVSLGLTGGAGHLGGADLVAALSPRNEVVDLLDREIDLLPGEVWESENFDTSRFTGIGLKISGEGQASCRTFWRWTADEALLADGPEVRIASRDTPRTGFGDVLGMEVRIGCVASSTEPATIADVKLMFRR